MFCSILQENKSLGFGSRARSSCHRKHVMLAHFSGKTFAIFVLVHTCSALSLYRILDK